MPIDFFSAPDGTHARQSFESPTIYLDHWAVRLFAEDIDLQNRLVQALLSKGGTLLLSNITLGEFAALTDARHVLQAENFLQRLLPNIYFTDFEFDRLLQKEEQEPNNARRFWPPADLQQLKFFVERSNTLGSGLSMRGFLALVHESRAQIALSTSHLKQLLVAGLTAARDDAAFVSRARSVSPSDKRPRTLLIFGELLRTFNLDANASMSENDAIDLLHAAMPVNCCDFVLLDGAWAERVQKMKLRISKTDMDMPLAACFSERDDGIKRFLAAVEDFDKAANASKAAVPR